MLLFVAPLQLLALEIMVMVPSRVFGVVVVKQGPMGPSGGVAGCLRAGVMFLFHYLILTTLILFPFVIIAKIRVIPDYSVT